MSDPRSKTKRASQPRRAEARRAAGPDRRPQAREPLPRTCAPGAAESTRRARGCALVLVACVLGAASSAAAAGGKSTAPAASAGAAIEDPCLSDRPCSDLYESAQALSKSGQFAAAVANYESAYRMHPMPWLLVNIGRVHQKSGSAQAAIDSYRRYFAVPESDREAATNAKAREYLRQAEEDLKRPTKSTVIREREVSGPRPLWRILSGVGLMALGATGLGFGIGGLAFNGTCVQSPVPPALECDRKYATVPMGVGLAAAGGLVMAAGVVLVALPGPKTVVRTTPSP